MTSVGTIIAVRGNDHDYKVTVKGSDDSAYNLTSCHLDLYVKKNMKDANVNAVMHKDSDVAGEFDIDSPASLGTAVITINPADTSSLELREYYFDIEIESASSEKYTIMRGKFILRPD